MSYVFEQLTPTIGSRIRDVDLRTASDDLIEAIKEQLATRGVVHVPGQFLRDTEHETVARRFGELWIGDFLIPVEGTHHVTPISNRGKRYAISERWHADSSYAKEPPYLAFLSAIDIPPLGGDTQWCNQYLVYEHLPEGIRKLIRNVRAVHYNRGQTYVRSQARQEALPGFAHPIVIKHPVTGKPVFYLGAHAEHLEDAGGVIDELTGRTEGKTIVSLLQQYNGQAAFSYRHQWQKGDLMIWDNRNTTHYAVHDYGDYPRYLQRVTTRGPQPAAYFNID